MGDATARGVIAATVIGSGMAMLDGTVVNIALRTIGEELDTSLAQLQWITNAYLLSLASLILLGGSLGDRFGRRRVFVVGTVWFALASVLCGLAPSPEVLIAARLLQGVGAALLTPGSLAILETTFRVEDRAPAIGAWSALGSIAAAVGPFVGGLLIDQASWRWIFWLNLPLAVLTVALARRFVPESRDPAPPERFDVAGAALVTLALAGLTYGLIEWGSAGRRRGGPARRRRAGRLRPRRAPGARAVAAAGAVHEPDLQRRQRDDAGGVRRARGRAVLPRHRAADGRRLLGVLRGHRDPADHGVHAPAGDRRRTARRADRSPGADDLRPAGDGGRARCSCCGWGRARAACAAT